MLNHILATIPSSKAPTQAGLRRLSSTRHPVLGGEEEEELKQKNKPTFHLLVNSPNILSQ
jgi:hypothetical protein